MSENYSDDPEVLLDMATRAVPDSITALLAELRKQGLIVEFDVNTRRTGTISDGLYHLLVKAENILDQIEDARTAKKKETI